jgi:hypothetical protein
MKTAIFCNTSAAPISSKSRNHNWYLSKLEELGLQFAKLEAFSTAGGIRPPYPYQWRATTVVRAGEDEPFEGLGGSLLEAMRELYLAAKRGWDEYEDEIDN